MKSDYIALLALFLVIALVMLAGVEARQTRRCEDAINFDFQREQLRQGANQARATVLATILSGAALVISFLSTEATRGQLRVAQNESRPWLHLTGANWPNPLLIDKDGLRFVLELGIENVGHSPAVQMIFYAAAFMPKGRNQTSDELRRNCDWLRVQTTSAHLAGSTIFPGEVQRFPLPITLSRADVDFGMAHGRGFPLPVVGCIDYAFTSDGERHRTPVEIEIVERDGTPTGYHFIYPADAPIPPAKITLVSNTSVRGLSAD